MPMKEKPKEQFNVNRAMAWNEKNMSAERNELLFQYALSNKLATKVEIEVMREGLASKDKKQHDKALRIFSHLVKGVQEDLKVKEDGALGKETGTALKKYADAQRMKERQKVAANEFKADAQRQKKFEESWEAKGPQGGPTRAGVVAGLKPRERKLRPGEAEYPGEKNPREAAKEWVAAHGVKALTPIKTEAVMRCKGSFTLILDDGRRVAVEGTFYTPLMVGSVSDTTKFLPSDSPDVKARAVESVLQALRFGTAKITSAGFPERPELQRDYNYLLEHTVAVSGEVKRIKKE